MQPHISFRILPESLLVKLLQRLDLPGYQPKRGSWECPVAGKLYRETGQRPVFGFGISCVSNKRVIVRSCAEPIEFLRSESACFRGRSLLFFLLSTVNF